MGTGGDGHYQVGNLDKWAFQGVEVANEAAYNLCVSDAAAASDAAFVDGYNPTTNHWVFNGLAVADQAAYNEAVYRAAHNGRNEAEEIAYQSAASELQSFKDSHDGRTPSEETAYQAAAYQGWLAGGGNGPYTADGYDKWAYQGTEVANEAAYNLCVSDAAAAAAAAAALAAAEAWGIDGQGEGQFESSGRYYHSGSYVGGLAGYMQAIRPADYTGTLTTPAGDYTYNITYVLNGAGDAWIETPQYPAAGIVLTSDETYNYVSDGNGWYNPVEI